MDNPQHGGTDFAVQATNDDAAVSKLSCVSKNYFKDDDIHFFVRRPARRSPVINRGYYARWAAIRMLQDQFLAAVPADNADPDSIPTKKQILSLGAGFDTNFFQLQEEGRAPYHYFEVDFAEVAAKKAHIITANQKLLTKLGPDVNIHKDKGELTSKHYSLLAADLRDLDGLDAALARAGLDSRLPTLILAECVLIYMDAPSSRAIVNWAGRKFSTSAFVIYEQIRPNDAFGQQMITNLESRGCPLLGIMDTPTLEAKEQRFISSGFERAQALDMDHIYNRRLDLVDVKRIERLEIFDEFEEWHIMQEHYCIAYGVNDKQELLAKFGFLENH